MIKLYSNCRYLSESGEILFGNILIDKAAIIGIYNLGEKPEKNPDWEIDFEGRIVFPGLINSHDHLYDTFWPKFGKAGEYRSWFEWEGEFKNSEVYRQKQLLSVADLYYLGMYRNVFSGVTLVVDHFPREISKNFTEQPLVNLLENYCLAHSISSQSLEWGEGIREEFKNSKGIFPFVLHCGEGFDA